MSALPLTPVIGPTPGEEPTARRRALSLSSSDAPAPLRGAVLADPHVPNLHWVPIDLAAALLQRTERALRLRAEELQKGGFAKRLCPTIGGQRKWHFSSRLDPRLAALAGQASAKAETPDPLLEFRRAAAAKQRSATAKASAVRIFRAWRRTAVVTDAQRQAELLAHIAARCGITTSVRRLYEWSDLVGPANVDHPSGFAAACAALLDRRGGVRESGIKMDEPAWDYFVALYLRDHRPSIKACWKLTKSESGRQGWTWVSLSRVKQLIKERLSASVVKLAREGEEAWQRAHLPPIAQDENAWAAGQCWETDHSRCDFFVRAVRGGQTVAVRPWLTVFLDRRSRRLMGWSMNLEASADTVRAALHTALSDDAASVPEVIVLDNGKDFASHEFCGATKQQRRRQDPADPGWAGLFGLLGIAPHFATPYNHNAKARVERFFGVVHRGFDRLDMAASWCGSEKEPRDPEAVKAILAEPAKLPTLDEARERFAAWAVAYNHDADRNIEALVTEGGERLSPAAWYHAHLPAYRALPRKAELLTMLEHKWARPLTVTKSGVRIRVDGRTFLFGAHEPALMDLVGSGRKVHVTYDPGDMSSVRVYDERFALLCNAAMNPRHGGLIDSELRREDLKEAIRRQRQHKRDVRRQVDTAAAVLPAAELAALVRRERERAETKASLEAAGVDAENAPPMRLVRTALTEQGGRGSAREGRRHSVPLRKAAGAEHDESPAAIAAEVRAAFNTGSTGVEDDAPDSFSLLDAVGTAPARRGVLDGVDILRELGA